MKNKLILLILLSFFICSCVTKVIYIKKEEAIQSGLVKEPYQDRNVTYTINLKLLNIETAQIMNSVAEETKTSALFKSSIEKLLKILIKDLKKGAKKERLAILISKDTDLDKKLLAHIEADLMNQGNFILVERSQVDKIINEQKFSSSDLVDASKTSALGKLLGVAKIILVNLMITEN